MLVQQCSNIFVYSVRSIVHAHSLHVCSARNKYLFLCTCASVCLLTAAGFRSWWPGSGGKQWGGRKAQKWSGPSLWSWCLRLSEGIHLSQTQKKLPSKWFWLTDFPRISPVTDAQNILVYRTWGQSRKATVMQVRSKRYNEGGKDYAIGEG